MRHIDQFSQPTLKSRSDRHFLSRKGKLPVAAAAIRPPGGPAGRARFSAADACVLLLTQFHRRAAALRSWAIHLVEKVFAPRDPPRCAARSASPTCPLRQRQRDLIASLPGVAGVIPDDSRPGSLVVVSVNGQCASIMPGNVDSHLIDLWLPPDRPDVAALVLPNLSHAQLLYHLASGWDALATAPRTPRSDPN